MKEDTLLRCRGNAFDCKGGQGNGACGWNGRWGFIGPGAPLYIRSTWVSTDRPHLIVPPPAYPSLAAGMLRVTPRCLPPALQTKGLGQTVHSLPSANGLLS